MAMDAAAIARAARAEGLADDPEALVAFTLGYASSPNGSAGTDESKAEATPAGAAADSKWAEDGWWTKWVGAQPDLTVEERVQLVADVWKGGEIMKNPDELRALFGRKTNPVAYDGFEPSGQRHVEPCLLCTCCCVSLRPSSTALTVGAAHTQPSASQEASRCCLCRLSCSFHRCLELSAPQPSLVLRDHIATRHHAACSPPTRPQAACTSRRACCGR